jgi:uncharacterized protein YndB with AHSA1/START domain
MDKHGKMLDAQTVEFVRLLPGPIERIWDYIADGRKRGEWFASGDLPAKVGEKFEMRFKHSELSPHQAPPPEKYIEMDKTGHRSVNTLLAFEPPHLLAFTFGPETHPGQVSEVEFRLTQEGTPEDNRVRLTLTHRKIPNLDFARGVSGGWHAHLAILEDKANGRVPPAFWDVWRSMEGAYETRYS